MSALRLVAAAALSTAIGSLSASATQAAWVNGHGLPIHVAPTGAGWTVSAEGDTATLRTSGSARPRVFTWDKTCNTWRDDRGEEAFTFDTDQSSHETEGMRSAKDFITETHVRVHWVPCDKLPRTVLQYAPLPSGGPSTGLAIPPFVGSTPVYFSATGGLALPGTVIFTTPEDLKLGGAFGGAIGVRTNIPGLAVQLDLTHTRREFGMFPGDFISTTTIGLTPIYSVPLPNLLNGSVVVPPGQLPPLPPPSFFGGIGITAEHIQEEYSTGGSGWGAGYQAVAGLTLPFATNLSFIAQGQYNNTFGPINASNGFPVQTGNVTVMGGLRFDFNPTPPGAPAPPP